MQRTAFCIHHYKAVMPAEGDCGELRNGRFAPEAADQKASCVRSRVKTDFEAMVFGSLWSDAEGGMAEELSCLLLSAKTGRSLERTHSDIAHRRSCAVRLNILLLILPRTRFNGHIHLEC
jgi:hypothetical protein